MRAVVVCVLAAGCGGSEGNSDGPTGSSDGSTTGSSGVATTESSTSVASVDASTTGLDTTDGTTTIDESTTDSTTGGEAGIVESCGLPEPCPAFDWQCDPSQAVNCAETPYGEALVCALQTLAAGDQAQLHVGFNGYLTGESDWLDIAILGGGGALRQYGMQSPRSLETDWEPPEQCTLRASEWFEACLVDDGGAEMHAACMDPYQWFEGECAGRAMCP